MLVLVVHCTGSYQAVARDTQIGGSIIQMTLRRRLSEWITESHVV